MPAAAVELLLEPAGTEHPPNHLVILVSSTLYADLPGVPTATGPIIVPDSKAGQ